jgi:aspartokinase/homoserine dehydrogenase 1
MTKLVVMKFGGSSVGDAASMQKVAAIVAAAHKTKRVVVVVSAISKVTDLLIGAAAHAAGKRRTELEFELKHIQNLHQTVAHELKLSPPDEATLLEELGILQSQLAGLLNSIFVLGELTPRGLDLILSFGERMSIQLLAAAIKQAEIPAMPVEATKLIVTSQQFGDARPLLDKSVTKAKPLLMKLIDKGVVPVVTGFIGATLEGTTATLGRGGSDYSATILGYCLDADEVWIWTDVDGAMTADPRIIPEAQTIPALSYNEAAELSYFGAKVLHPLTMVPASLKNIPIKVKNTFRPHVEGTTISDHVFRSEDGCKAITTVRAVSLVTLQGKGMTGVPGIAAKLFGAIAAEHISVLFISQASSEFNISLIVRHEDGPAAVHVLKSAFETDMAKQDIEAVMLEEHLAIVAVVGEGMKGHPGVAGKTLSSLGSANVNIVAIAQGSSERNISIVIHDAQTKAAVQAIHDAFELASSGVTT